MNLFWIEHVKLCGYTNEVLILYIRNNHNIGMYGTWSSIHSIYNENVTNRHQTAYIVIIAANGGWVQVFLFLYFLQIFDATGRFGQAA